MKKAHVRVHDGRPVPTTILQQRIEVARMRLTELIAEREEIAEWAQEDLAQYDIEIGRAVAACNEEQHKIDAEQKEVADLRDAIVALMNQVATRLERIDELSCNLRALEGGLRRLTEAKSACNITWQKKLAAVLSSKERRMETRLRRDIERLERRLARKLQQGERIEKIKEVVASSNFAGIPVCAPWLGTQEFCKQLQETKIELVENEVEKHK